MNIIGTKSLIAFEIGAFYANSKQLRHISIWLANKVINPIDNVVYLPSFCHYLSTEICRLRDNSLEISELADSVDEQVFTELAEEDYELHQVLNYDSSTCPAKCFFIERTVGNTLVFSYWDPRHEPKSEIGKVFGLKLSKNELLHVLSELSSTLSTDTFR